MQIVGIICEYNPLHLGHRKQIDAIRARYGADCGIVCLMSGNFVQRGHPAIVDKMLRAQAAISCGADLVLELPVTAALSSAEGFADTGVEILSRLCNVLCFGVENDDAAALMHLANVLCSNAFSPALQKQLNSGLSFPSARQAALSELGLKGEILEKPNNILAVEYCKAILRQDAPLEIFPLLRQGNYHDTRPHKTEPSATAVRLRMESGQSWLAYVPEPAREIFRDAPIHTLQQGEKAILYRLRTMDDGEFESLPYGNEGLWRKFMHACRAYATLEEILSATKSKRYTRSRLDRMAMCAFLGLTRQDLSEQPPYCRVLAFNDQGRSLLHSVKNTDFFRNIGEDTGHPYQNLEWRCGDLYTLFSATSAPPRQEHANRVFYFRPQEAENCPSSKNSI